MIFSFLSLHEKLELYKAITDSLNKAFSNFSCTEPQLIANLVFELPNHINGMKWRSEKIKITAGGVFVHSKPLVTCSSFPDTSSKSVEIGDILIVRTYVLRGKIEERRALLFQAKKVEKIPYNPDKINQWHLYELWPAFNYANGSGNLNGKRRHIKEMDMYDAAKYLLILRGDSFPCCYNDFCLSWPFCCLEYRTVYTAQPTRYLLSRYRCFTRELIDFLSGNAGKIFDKPAVRSRGWNRVIYDLINETARAKTIYMGRAANQPGKVARGNGLFFMTQAQSKFFLVSGGEYSDYSNIPPEIPYERLSDDDGIGMSIIEIIVEQE